jgi:hypothetical protein
MRELGVHERKIIWLEYLQRMPSERAAKQLPYYQPIGRRDPGRARRRWLDISGQNRLTSSALAERCWLWLLPASILSYFSTLKMEVVRSSETSVNYSITPRNIPEDSIPYNIKTVEIPTGNFKYKLCQRMLSFGMFWKGSYI